ncbi:MAG: DUF2255 family protein [Deltaproteobacteria bacterium]|nr:DUF2255 family protein [Deltaproteobacteria bacterium]
MLQIRLVFVALSMALLLASPVLASEASDVSVYTDEGTIEVLTSDEDGAARETTIWIVIVDGAAYIRTGGTSWGENVQRASQVQVRLEGATRAFEVVFVEDDAVRTQITDAFREKYGFQDKVVSFLRGSSRPLIMRLTEASASVPAS